jgi:hypothetical protein
MVARGSGGMTRGGSSDVVDDAEPLVGGVRWERITTASRVAPAPRSYDRVQDSCPARAPASSDLTIAATS